MGYEISKMSFGQCASQIERWLANGVLQKNLICANPHSLVLATDDPVFQQALHSADLLTPDGVGIVLASKILGGRIRERVTGSDIFWELSKSLNTTGGMSYFFLGSTEKTLAAIRERMTREFPNIIFAGSYSPPFKTKFNEKEKRLMVELVNRASPHVLWVGMTAPKQEKWIYQYRDQLNVKFIGAIGAVFDFYAGNIRRSPRIFQRYGLEWLPRLIQEPRRMFRRNFVSSPIFLLRVFEQWFRKKCV